MNDARAEFTMVTLPNGMVLAAGSGSAEIYNPITDTWTRTSGMQATRFGAAGTLLPDGRVFLAGGDSGGGFLGNFCPADAEVYDAVTVSFTQRDGSIENLEKNDAAQYCDTNAQKSSDDKILHKLTGSLKFRVPSYRLRCKN